MSTKRTAAGSTDIAALVGSAVAASIALTASPGEYGATSLIMSLSLLLIIYGYVWPHYREMRESIATASAIGVAAVPGLGFALEQILKCNGVPPVPDDSRVSDWWILLGWAAIVILVSIVDSVMQLRSTANQEAASTTGDAA